MELAAHVVEKFLNKDQEVPLVTAVSRVCRAALPVRGRRTRAKVCSPKAGEKWKNLGQAFFRGRQTCLLWCLDSR